MQNWHCFTPLSTFNTQSTEILDNFFFYSNSAGDPDRDFHLHTSTGALSTSRGLDRETKAEYTLEIVATDRGSPALSTTVTVEIKVLDVNDNSPVFSKSSYTVEVSEDAAEGYKVLEVSGNGTHNTCFVNISHRRRVYLTFTTKDFMCQSLKCVYLFTGVSRRC